MIHIRLFVINIIMFRCPEQKKEPNIYYYNIELFCVLYCCTHSFSFTSIRFSFFGYINKPTVSTVFSEATIVVFVIVAKYCETFFFSFPPRETRRPEIVFLLPYFVCLDFCVRNIFRRQTKWQLLTVWP